MSRTDPVLKWMGAATLALVILPLLVVLGREVPGMIREIKIATMGFRGGWKQAH
jgi:hypothetical protein